MAMLKCKMCGGDLSVEEGMKVVECEYCGSRQTVPSVDDEKKVALFTRANRLRSGCDFDKAYGVYESIVTEFPEEAEAYWGLVLCKYGIEYVDDPGTKKKVPTCHRSSFENVLEDPNFEMVMEYSDPVSRAVYREEAKAIETLRSGIIEISSKEDPYDVFICYKETDENGQRTIDSVIAQDVYDALIDKGYKVFFSRITLEDKLGQEYEPYIFAALNSSKVMLAFGTNYEYYNAVWVKNEWSRFLSLIERGEKKTLIPCYKDIDAYDMPAEFKRLQGQDMGKIGAIQDLIRGIGKIIPSKNESNNDNGSQSPSDSKVKPLLDRMEIFLMDGEWEKADEYAEKVLDLEPKNAYAYWGKLLSSRNIHGLEEARNYHCKPFFDEEPLYKKALMFADPRFKAELESILARQKKNFEDFRNNRKKEDAYSKAMRILEKAKTSADYSKAISLLMQISGYKDADEKIISCKESRKQCIYDAAKRKKQMAKTASSLRIIAKSLDTISDYKDATSLAQLYREEADAMDNNSKKEIVPPEQALQIFEEYKAFMDMKSKAEMITKYKSDLGSAKYEYSALESKRRNVLSTFDAINETTSKLKKIDDEISRCSQRRNSLGFFAGREKKQLEEQIASLTNQKQILQRDLQTQKQAVQPYSSPREIDNELEEKGNKISQIEESIRRLESELTPALSASEIYSKILEAPILEAVEKIPGASSLLSKDPEVQRYRKVKQNSLQGDVYSPDLSGTQLKTIEKLNYWDQPADDRDEFELLEDIEIYLNNAKLLEENGYTIEREVLPSDLRLDADAVLRRNLDAKLLKDYEQWGKETEAGEFTANTYGKPLSFLISKDEKPALVLMILPRRAVTTGAFWGNPKFQYWGVSGYRSVYLKWIKYWCDEQHIPLITVYNTLPNTEHYVVRRVYEALKLVKGNGYKRHYSSPRTGETTYYSC